MIHSELDHVMQSAKIPAVSNDFILARNLRFCQSTTNGG